MTDYTDLIARLRENWIAWDRPTNRELCMNESRMAMDCNEAADALQAQATALVELQAEVERKDKALRELVAAQDEWAKQDGRVGAEWDRLIDAWRAARAALAEAPKPGEPQ